MSKTPITDAAEYELQEAYDGYDGLSSAPTKVVNPDDMRALEIKYNEAQRQLNLQQESIEKLVIQREKMTELAYEQNGKATELRKELDVYKEDLKQAAGELMLPLPEPGSDMARICVVNRLLKYDIEKLNKNINFTNDVLEEIKGAAHSKALLGGSPDEYLGALLKVSSLAGQGLAKLKNQHG